MKKIICLLTTLILLVGLLAFSASAAGNGSLSVTGASGKQGDTVTLSVNLNSNPGLISMKFTVSYPSDLELVSVQNSGLLGGWTTPSPTISSPYTVRWADSLAPANSTATGKILTLKFKIKDTATPGAKTVTLNFSESRDVTGGKNTFNSPSATVQVNCKAHTYGNWTKTNDNIHTRTCTGCGTPETQNHSWNNGSVTTTPACNQLGEKTYTCSVCQGTKTEELPKPDHTYGKWEKVDDSTHKHTCTVCQNPETKAHTWDNGKVTKTPNCKEEGEKTYTCTGCKATKVEKLDKTTDHTYGQWEKVDDSTHKHTCTVCGNPETKDHTWDNGKVTKTPNCKEEGEKTYTCTGCKATKVEKLDKTTDHTYGQWEKVDDSTHKHTCTVCGNPEAKDHTWDNGKVTDKPNCQKEGEKTYTCTGCKATKVEKLGITDHAFTNACDTDCNTPGCDFTRTITHKYSSKWSSNASQHYHACSVCGDKKDGANHKQSDWIIDKAAEPLKAGSKHIECTVCKKTLKTASIPALDCPHEGEPNVKDAREATCLEAGYTGDKVCALCETVLEEGTEIAPLGHDSKLANDKKATCQEAGYTGDEVCSRCNATLKQGQALEIVDHDYEDGVCTMCKAEEPKPVNVTLIVIIAAGVAVVAAGAVVFIKKRK